MRIKRLTIVGINAPDKGSNGGGINFGKFLTKELIVIMLEESFKIRSERFITTDKEK